MFQLAKAGEWKTNARDPVWRANARPGSLRVGILAHLCRPLRGLMNNMGFRSQGGALRAERSQRSEG